MVGQGAEWFVTCEKCEACTGIWADRATAAQAWNVRMGELKSLGVMWQRIQGVIQDNLSGASAIILIKALKEQMFSPELESQIQEAPEPSSKSDLLFTILAPKQTIESEAVKEGDGNE